MKTKTPITITIDPDLCDKLRAMAIEENRTVSNLVETLLLKAFNDK